MGTYATEEYVPTDPTGSEAAGTIDNEIVKKGRTIWERFIIEHDNEVDEDIAATGIHRLGATGVLGVDTQATIEAGATYLDGAPTPKEVNGALMYDSTRQCIVRSDGTDWKPVTPYIAHHITATNQALTSTASYLTTLINAKSIAGLSVGDIIKVDFWGSYSQNGGNFFSRLWIDSAVYGSSYISVGGSVSGYQTTAFNMTRTFIATTTTHVVDIKGAASSGVETMTGGVLVMVYPQGIA